MIDVKAHTAYYTTKPNEIHELIRSKDGVRVRGADSLKSLASDFNISAGAFAKDFGELGYLWAEKVKGDKYFGMPSLEEVLIGLYLHYCELI